MSPRQPCATFLWVTLCALLLTVVNGDGRVAGNLFGGSCSGSDRGCFLGLFGALMHSGNGASCDERCILFPLFKPRFSCGPCPSVVGPSAPTPAVAPASGPAGSAPTPSAAAPTTAIAPASVIAPAPVAPSPGYDITLGFDNVPTEDLGLFTSAAARWERIITNDYVDTSSRGMIPASPKCVFPSLIDDVYFCIYYGEINQGDVVGLGGYDYRRSSGNRTAVAGFVKVKESEVANGKKEGWLTNLILHEMGHALGIGLLGECPATNANSRANREYQAISGCTTNVPTDGIGDDCGHFQEECLAGEIMTPIVDVDSVLSRLSIGWLEDAGYSVNYDEADASYGRNSLGTNPNGNCKCSATRKTLRQLSRSDRSNRVRSLGRYLDGSSDRTASSRKLSEKGYQAAAAFGTSYLSNKRASAESSGRAQLLNDHDVEYVGDQAVSVIYRENGHLHSVIVRRD